MYSLETIKAINTRPRIRRDNFNRDSSRVFSSAGVVIHSGIHRSTAFISATDPDFADSHFAACYWLRQDQAAINGFIETIIDGGSLEHAEQEAFRRSRPAWQVRVIVGTGKNKGQLDLAATCPSGRLTRSASASTWRHLHARTA